MSDSKEKEKSVRGKKSRIAGRRFELKVRAKLEKMGFIVVRWSNQVDLKNNKLVPAKSKYNPFLKRVISGITGFPDYLCYKTGIETEVIGVEAKLGKYLDAEEKKKVQWFLKNKIFSRILIAYPGKKRGEIELEEFDEEKQLN